MQPSPKRPLLLGLITALPIPAVMICFLSVMISMINGTKTLGITGVVFIIFAALTVSVHTAMLFYYLIKMQTLKSINPNHYLVWLPVLMAFGGQIIFWYLFFWKPTAPAPQSAPPK